MLHNQLSSLYVSMRQLYFLRTKRMHLLIYAVKYCGPLDMDLQCAQIIGRLSVLVYVNL